MDGGAWWATVHGVTKSQTRLSDFTLLGFRNCKCTVVREGESKPAVSWWQEPGNQQCLVLSLSVKECATPLLDAAQGHILEVVIC